MADIQIAGITIKLSWVSRVIRTDQPESAEKLLALLSGISLVLIALAFTFVAVFQALHLKEPWSGNINSVVMTGLLAIAGYLALFAKFIHKDQQKGDSDAPNPPQQGGPQ